MRIAIVLMKYTPFGGYERQAAIVAEELSACGHDVTVLANEWKGDKGAGIRFHRIPMLRWASWLKVLSFAILSKRHIAKEAFDLVIAFDRTLVMDIYRGGNACHREWMAFRKAHGGPFASLSMAVNPLHRVINSVERRAFERLQSMGGTIVVLSPLGQEQIRRHYSVDEDRFVVIPPIVDLKRLDVAGYLARRDEHRKKLGIRDGSTALLHVGSGFRIKGLRSTIEALGLLAGGGLDYSLFVAGSDRKETARLKGLASRLGMAARVKFLGGVKDISGLYAASDLFVVPSLFETFGVAAVEALSFGLPVIVGRGAGAASFIEKEGAGLVIDVPANPARLAALIQETVEGEKRLRESGQMELVRKRRMNTAAACAREPVIKKYRALIERVAGEGRGKDIDKNRPKKLL